MSRTKTRKEEVALLPKKIPEPTLVQKEGYELLTIYMTMLPSVNRKLAASGGRREGRRFYINSDYRDREEKEVESLKDQVAHVQDWHIDTHDRYLLLYEFPFPSELKQDSHNPLKSTADCLKKAGVIYNDNRLMQECLTKVVDPARNWAKIEVYKFSSKNYRPVPLEALLSLFLQSYQQSIHTIERNIA